MFHLSCSLEEGDRSEAICCKNRRFSTVLKLQIVLASLLVAFAAALFCLPAKNAYANTSTFIDSATIDGVTYEYFVHERMADSYGVKSCAITGVQSNGHTAISVPEKINDYYVCGFGTYFDGESPIEIKNNESVNLSKCSQLREVVIYEGSLVSLKLPNNSVLDYVRCQDNKLTALDVSGCKALRTLACDGNNLTSLNISGLTALEYLHCQNNNLRSLDVSGLNALKWLSCENNQISNTKALEAWLAQDGHDGQVLPQKATDNSGNAGNSGDNTSGSADNNNAPTTLTGTWKHNSKGWWYAYSNGTYAKGMKKIGGATYYFDSKGWMKTGWQHATGNSDWYYFNKSGAMKTGWLKSGGKWYYLNPTDGKMKTGFYNVGKTRYYSNGSGVIKTGWQKISNSWYYFASSGAMKTGWAKTGGKWYYLNTEGKMQTGKQVISGKTYFLNSSGAMRTGWIKDGSAWRYANKSGVMQTSKWIGNYYVDANGTMLTNQWVKTNGKEYYVNKAGKWTGAKR